MIASPPPSDVTLSWLFAKDISIPGGGEREIARSHPRVSSEQSRSRDRVPALVRGRNIRGPMSHLIMARFADFYSWCLGARPPHHPVGIVWVITGTVFFHRSWYTSSGVDTIFSIRPYFVNSYVVIRMQKKKKKRESHSSRTRTCTLTVAPAQTLG